MELRCPICKKPTDSDKDRDFPFCSERCRLMDLGNWASEKYKVTQPAIDEDAPKAYEPPASDENEL
ncbi:MAG: DNA gyrase inhibitor YacG [Candidatus Acidiferrales bacterium]